MRIDTRPRSASLGRFALSAVLLLAPFTHALFPAHAGTRAEQTSEAITEVAHFPYSAGTDIDFAGRFVYAAQEGDEGGVHIFDISGSRPREVAFVSCPGTQNDVAVVRPGLIALGF
ncbi:MAG TPA: hypothetical protein VHJ82_10245, partial [Actinomycetota bacterium]|nr:hypothetical protein [Actinomycetota bacterium]